MTHGTDPHDALYRAAAAAIHDQTPSPVSLADTFAIGDYVTFRLKGWSPSSYDDGRVMGHHAGKLLVETAGDIVEVDPRQWPDGNLLPF